LHLSSTPTAGICVSIASEQTETALNIAKQAEELADTIEIRLDTLEQPAIDPFIAGLSKPLLFTNRPDWEGGNYKGEEAERVSFLQEAILAGASFVDIEVKTSHTLKQILFKAIDATKTKLIISWHDFSGTPSSEELGEILHQQRSSGAHVGKIVTMAEDYQDVLRVLSLQSEAAEHDFPLIAFCMGKAGMISRLATLKLGGFMTYAAPDTGNAAAPGQLPVSYVRETIARLTNGD
jgi:3-dehydroquinate dehydratase-1/3-dehydroquinate dehydratase/shikimate dehydrogenase